MIWQIKYRAWKKTASRYNAKWAKTKENRERVHAQKQQFQCEIEAIFQSYDVYSPDETYENLLEQLREKFDAYLNASKHINEYHTKIEGLWIHMLCRLR